MVTAEIVPSRARQEAGATPSRPHAGLGGNFLWSLAGTLVYAACQWGMLIVLAKLGSAEMVGQFGLALAITGPVFMFTNLQLRGVQATDSRGDFYFADYLGLRLLVTAAGLGVVASLALVTGPTWSTAAVIAIVGAAKAVEALSDVYFGFLQKHEHMDRIGISLILKGALALAAFGIALFFTHDILWGAAALAAISLLILVAYDVPSAAVVARHDVEPSAESLRPRWRSGPLVSLTRLALPLGVVMFIVSFTTNIPRYYVEHLHGLRELGVFTAISYLVVAGSRVLIAMGESASPRLAKFYATGQTDSFRALLFRVMLFAAGLGGSAVVLALLFGPELLTLLYRREYAEHADVLRWLAGAGAIGYLASALGYAMTAARFFFVQAPLFLLSGLITALACMWLVPDHHLVGAAWAMGIGLAVQLVGSAAVLLYALSVMPRRAAS